MTAATRTSGVAPLSVFFDTVDAADSGGIAPYDWTSGVVQPADPDATLYEWDFGDGSSGTWTQTGLSRNTATGYTAAHVYETAGTYTPTLTVTETDGTVTTYTQTITVSAFAGTTHYASASGSGDGTSTGTPSSLSAGITWVNGGAGRRLLLNRGDTFTLSATNLTASGPSILGAYGSGANPVINTPGEISVSASDWRIMDVDLVDTGAAANWGLILSTTTRTDNVSFIRCKTTGFGVGIGWSEYGSVITNPHAGSTLYECEVDSPDTNGVFVGSYHLAVLGCYIHDIGISHVLRVWAAHKGAISNNKLWNPGATRHALKLHGHSYSSGAPDTRYVTVSDNLVRGKTWSVTIGPQDSVNDERVHNVVYERNRHYEESSVQIGVLVEAREILLRNNILNGTGAASGYTGISIDQRGIEPTPDSIRVYNNTIVRTDTAASLVGLQTASVASNVTAQNNLAYAPSTSSKSVLSGSAGSGWTADHNSLETVNPFTNPGAGDFTLSAGAAPADAGTTITAVRKDFAGVSRPQGSAYSIGAYER